MAKVKNKVDNKVERPQNKHLIPLKKGETANPNGRPVGQRNYKTIYNEALIKLATLNGKTKEEIEDEIISSGLMLARKGDYRYYKDTLDRLYGTAVQHTEIVTNTDTKTYNFYFDPSFQKNIKQYEDNLKQQILNAQTNQTNAQDVEVIE
jgi:hypothetical protein